jgi:hypothetical protein
LLTDTKASKESCTADSPRDAKISERHKISGDAQQFVAQ